MGMVNVSTPPQPQIHLQPVILHCHSCNHHIHAQFNPTNSIVVGISCFNCQKDIDCQPQHAMALEQPYNSTCLTCGWISPID